jgi:chromosome segregation ATPase
MSSSSLHPAFVGQPPLPVESATLAALRETVYSIRRDMDMLTASQQQLPVQQSHDNGMVDMNTIKALIDNGITESLRTLLHQNRGDGGDGSSSSLVVKLQRHEDGTYNGKPAPTQQQLVDKELKKLHMELNHIKGRQDAIEHSHVELRTHVGTINTTLDNELETLESSCNEVINNMFDTLSKKVSAHAQRHGHGPHHQQQQQQDQCTEPTSCKQRINEFAARQEVTLSKLNAYLQLAESGIEDNKTLVRHCESICADLASRCEALEERMNSSVLTVEEHSQHTQQRVDYLDNRVKSAYDSVNSLQFEFDRHTQSMQSSVQSLQNELHDRVHIIEQQLSQQSQETHTLLHTHSAEQTEQHKKLKAKVRDLQSTLASIREIRERLDVCVHGLEARELRSVEEDGWAHRVNDAVSMLESRLVTLEGRVYLTGAGVGVGVGSTAGHPSAEPLLAMSARTQHYTQQQQQQQQQQQLAATQTQMQTELTQLKETMDTLRANTDTNTDACNQLSTQLSTQLAAQLVDITSTLQSLQTHADTLTTHADTLQSRLDAFHTQQEADKATNEQTVQQLQQQWREQMEQQAHEREQLTQQHIQQLTQQLTQQFTQQLDTAQEQTVNTVTQQLTQTLTQTLAQTLTQTLAQTLTDMVTPSIEEVRLAMQVLQSEVSEHTSLLSKHTYQLTEQQADKQSCHQSIQSLQTRHTNLQRGIHEQLQTELQTAIQTQVHTQIQTHVQTHLDAHRQETETALQAVHRTAQAAMTAVKALTELLATLQLPPEQHTEQQTEQQTVQLSELTHTVEGLQQLLRTHQSHCESMFGSLSQSHEQLSDHSRDQYSQLQRQMEACAEQQQQQHQAHSQPAADSQAEQWTDLSGRVTTLHTQMEQLQVQFNDLQTAVQHLRTTSEQTQQAQRLLPAAQDSPSSSPPSSQQTPPKQQQQQLQTPLQSPRSSQRVDATIREYQESVQNLQQRFTDLLQTVDTSSTVTQSARKSMNQRIDDVELLLSTLRTQLGQIHHTTDSGSGSGSVATNSPPGGSQASVQSSPSSTLSSTHSSEQQVRESSTAVLASEPSSPEQAVIATATVTTHTLSSLLSLESLQLQIQTLSVAVDAIKAANAEEFHDVYQNLLDVTNGADQCTADVKSLKDEVWACFETLDTKFENLLSRINSTSFKPISDSPVRHSHVPMPATTASTPDRPQSSTGNSTRVLASPVPVRIQSAQGHPSAATSDSPHGNHHQQGRGAEEEYQATISGLGIGTGSSDSHQGDTATVAAAAARVRINQIADNNGASNSESVFQSPSRPPVNKKRSPREEDLGKPEKPDESEVLVPAITGSTIASEERRHDVTTDGGKNKERSQQMAVRTKSVDNFESSVMPHTSTVPVTLTPKHVKGFAQMSAIPIEETEQNTEPATEHAFFDKQKGMMDVDTVGTDDIYSTTAPTASAVPAVDASDIEESAEDDMDDDVQEDVQEENEEDLLRLAVAAKRKQHRANFLAKLASTL